MAETRMVNLIGLSRDNLLIIAERACSVLTIIANQVTTDEGDEQDTEDEFGLPASEIVEIAHDNMIAEARSALDRIVKEFNTDKPHV